MQAHNGQGAAAIRREQVDIIPAELESALRQVQGAAVAYQALPDSRKKQFIYWLQTARTEVTRQSRIQMIIEEALSGTR